MSSFWILRECRVAMILSGLFYVGCGGSGGDATPTPSPTATPSPSPSPTASPDPEQVAEEALVQLSDLPSGFRDQGGQVDRGTADGVLAIGSRSFARSLSAGEGLSGVAVTVASVVIICEDIECAQGRASASHLTNATTLTALSSFSMADPDASVISFPSLGDETNAVEVSGTGSVGGQFADIGLRSVAIRYGSTVVTVSTTSLGLGSIRELEEIARNLDRRLGDREE